MPHEAKGCSESAVNQTFDKPGELYSKVSAKSLNCFWVLGKLWRLLSLRRAPYSLLMFIVHICTYILYIYTWWFSAVLNLIHQQVNDLRKGIFSMGLPCQRCRGSGMVLDHPCRTCRGETTKMMTREIRVSCSVWRTVIQACQWSNHRWLLSQAG